ncbi:acyl-ACP--UDP-N-acetylglucosamine O-acyltransferase [Sulfurirhabdus autotrophica]|uniref:Acyl-[acyl-carrier-protein]--UDP-N-acetylglucosamine O-acyltransferase n=1 Tax=Sulfurirhabdus autotrophica TaxID=1706046 RepID=A0A4R3YG51_9PROT|nr:acyl-ACP--UDP-N-acetylglucosamine O-acyltransferase [Sulfurirhabdus autotrophica]TCV90188.1 acyl-[acyl-carrier-protein]--UDP-N-acetylglucosamine O-acyltransferase [Sulfurirhabdus autotrophica]
MIHATAIVGEGAKLAADVEVGPYSIIGDHVEIGSGTKIGPHVVITGHTRIGKDNQIFQFASLGEVPQDKKFAGEPTRLEIGDRNVIRESCTLNVGTIQDVGVTKIGNDNWIMAYVHIAHDCQIGNNTIFANNASLAGHVHIDDFVILGGFTLVHQFCHVGAHVFTGMGSSIVQDVPPYVTVAGNPSKPHGINSEGLKRRGYSSEAIMQIKRAYKTLYRAGLTLEEAKRALSEQVIDCPELGIFLEFLAASSRGIVR